MPVIVINGVKHGVAMRNKRARHSRDERKIQIVKEVELLTRAGKSATVNSIAKRLNYSVSTLLRNMINELADVGILTRQKGTHWNGFDRYTYGIDYVNVRIQFSDLWAHVTQSIGDQDGF